MSNNIFRNVKKVMKPELPGISTSASTSTYTKSKAQLELTRVTTFLKGRTSVDGVSTYHLSTIYNYNESQDVNWHVSIKMFLPASEMTNCLFKINNKPTSHITDTTFRPHG